MLGKILMSGILLMLLIASMSGAILSAIGMKEDFKDKEWAGAFGLFGCCLLLSAISILVVY